MKFEFSGILDRPSSWVRIKNSIPINSQTQHPAMPTIGQVTN